MKKRKSLLGSFYALLAIALFIGQMGFILLRVTLYIEYIDDRLFYIINIACSIFIWAALVLLFTFTKQQKQLLTSLLVVFILIHGVLTIQSPSKVTNIRSASPDGEHVLVLKHHIDTNEVIYYRPLYHVFARPMVRLTNVANEELSITWLATDVAVLTYEEPSGRLQQFVATYGYRGTTSYYYVGPEIQGAWEGDSAFVRSDTEGITVDHEGTSTLFTWEQIEQFGTLAIVLKEDNEAKWTISLNENFERLASASELNPGDITLYQARKGESDPIVLQRTTGL